MLTKFNHANRLVALVVLYLLPAQYAPGQRPALPPPSAQQTLTRINEYKNAAVNVDHFSGSILVARDGQPIMSKGSGMANYQLNVPHTPSGKVWANGLSFSYVEEGSGTPVVLVHGSVSDYREWSAQMSPLAKRYRVIAYSRRYHWPNSPPSKDVDASLESQADDLGAILKSMGLTPAHIVGHSYGGAVALYLTLRHPELVRTLILAEPAISSILGTLPEDDPVSKDSQAVRTEMKNVFATGDPERIVSTYAARVAPGEFEKATPALRQMLLANVTAFQLDYNSRRPSITCEEAQRVAVPVLVLSGERSPLGLRSIAETAARCLNATKFVKIPQATHWMQHDRAQAFNAAVLSFLDRQGK